MDNIEGQSFIASNEDKEQVTIARSNERGSGEKETGRLEAFSDGVFSIAMTLLVLNITVPTVADVKTAGGLSNALFHTAARWPTYIAYVLSFVTVLILWANHHRIFKLIQRTDHFFLMINGLVLMAVSILPFPTAVVAQYGMDSSSGNNQAAILLYIGISIVLALALNFLWWYASWHYRLLDKRADPRIVKAITRQYALGPIMYLVSFMLAFISVPVSIGLIIFLLAFYAVTSGFFG